MGKNINGYVSDESVVTDIKNAANVSGVSPSRYVGDACVMRLRGEGRLSGGAKARLQLLVGEALDSGADPEVLEQKIISAKRKAVK